MALTLDKAKAKELRQEVEKANPQKSAKKKEGQEEEKGQLNKLEDFFPNENDVKEIQDKYKSLIKTSQDRSNLGKVMQFRVAEAKETYFIVKSLDAEKKSKNIIAILPKALVGKFFLNSLTLEDLTF